MESEKQTRRTRIDPLLKSQGWTIKPFDEAQPLAWSNETAVEEFPTKAGPADYALCIDGQVLGIVEAKKLTLGPQNVLTQAERYSRGATKNPFNFDGLRVPFLYSTNGEVIWFRDARHSLNHSRKVVGFHTPSALRQLMKRDFDESLATLAQLPNDHLRLREYQRGFSYENSR